MQSLLDPEQFEFTSERWLHDIKDKLRDYQSTEGMLPMVAESEIECKTAAEVKHSPLPVWLETMIQQHTMVHNGSLSKNLLGYSDVEINGERRRITFDSEVALNQPSIEHITLQHDWVRKLLKNLGEFDDSKNIPSIRSINGQETPGFWSLWQVSASNELENKVRYQSFFIADNGKVFAPYANDIWTRFVNGTHDFKLDGPYSIENGSNVKTTLENALYISFQNLEAELVQKMDTKHKNKLRSYEFQKSRIIKIGIENIRRSKMQRLEKEQSQWMKDFESSKKIIPGLKQLLMIRIDE
jgi:hypothetical protein